MHVGMVVLKSFDDTHNRTIGAPSKLSVVRKAAALVVYYESRKQPLVLFIMCLGCLFFLNLKKNSSFLFLSSKQMVHRVSRVTSEN